jgi:hypothetical protein
VQNRLEELTENSGIHELIFIGIIVEENKRPTVRVTALEEITVVHGKKANGNKKR